MNNPLYERIGGEAAVSAAVNLFYRKVLNDYRINRFFDSIDMDSQIAVSGQRNHIARTKTL